MESSMVNVLSSTTFRPDILSAFGATPSFSGCTSSKPSMSANQELLIWLLLVLAPQFHAST